MLEVVRNAFIRVFDSNLYDYSLVANSLGSGALIRQERANKAVAGSSAGGGGLEQTPHHYLPHWVPKLLFWRPLA